jgi:hypothetical protein
MDPLYVKGLREAKLLGKPRRFPSRDWSSLEGGGSLRMRVAHCDRDACSQWQSTLAP